MDDECVVTIIAGDGTVTTLTGKEAIDDLNAFKEVRLIHPQVPTSNEYHVAHLNASEILWGDL